MSRGDLTEEGWKVIEPLLPSERERWGRPAGEVRQREQHLPQAFTLAQKGGLKKKHLVVRGEASPVKFTLSLMSGEGCSCSTSRAGKWRTAKRTKR